MKRLVVFLYTHSDPTTGDLHCMAGVGVEIGVVCISFMYNFPDAPDGSQFFEQILGGDLNAFAAETLSLLCLELCGGVWQPASARQEIQQFAQL